MTDKNMSNQPIELELARKGGKAWLEGNKKNAQGDALAVRAMCGVWATYEFTFLVPINKDENETRVGRLDQMHEELKNAEGGKDNKATAARFNALSSNLFGIPEPSNAIAQSIRRALLTARYLRHNGATVDLDGKGQLKAPYGLVMPKPPADASTLDKETFEALKDKVVSLDGKQGLSLTELRNRAAAAFPSKTRAPKNKDNAPSEEQSFAQSVAFVSKTLEKLTAVNSADGDESDVALSNERRRELFKLAQLVSAYFTADPMGDEELTPEAAAA